ncbi:co-chaperone GroES [candidate division WWE3 bacterium]|jgi:chaperonin GroES|uniref:Co-chaperonin GroES n=1 Tax=candidate division WWE3 bacterium TaxID=2053526 RepID=A0A3A4ZCF0_UNCKA|nr:MAG: co-chaperone GroES [candidate division WWE3 bacterium]
MTTTVNKVRPLSDYILIEPLEKETTLPSGIVIPDTAKEKPQEGKVVSVGPGRRDDDGDRVPMEIKAGDIIMYKKWGGTEIKVEGKEYLLVKEEDILAVIES